jgi:hypothetical protein
VHLVEGWQLGLLLLLLLLLDIRINSSSTAVLEVPETTGSMSICMMKGTMMSMITG